MTKPIIVVKVPCKLLYVCHSSERILNKMFNFLALLDIRVFGRLYTRGPTLQKILYEISKSIDFNEIILISSDFTDFNLIS